MSYDIAEDQRSLEKIVIAFDVKPSQLKDIPARIAEKVARFKPNERLVQRSPLSDIEELEALTAAVHAKSLGWRMLLEVEDDRLDKTLLQKLLDRAPGSGGQAGKSAIEAGPSAHAVIVDEPQSAALLCRSERQRQARGSDLVLSECSSITVYQ